MYKKANVIFGQFEGKLVDVEGTDKELWGKSWADMNGNPCALEFAMRSSLTDNLSFGECLSEPVYYCKIDGLGKLFGKRQLEFTN